MHTVLLLNQSCVVSSRNVASTWRLFLCECQVLEFSECFLTRIRKFALKAFSPGKTAASCCSHRQRALTCSDPASEGVSAQNIEGRGRKKGRAWCSRLEGSTFAEVEISIFLSSCAWITESWSCRLILLSTLSVIQKACRITRPPSATDPNSCAGRCGGADAE